VSTAMLYWWCTSATAGSMARDTAARQDRMEEASVARQALTGRRKRKLGTGCVALRFPDVWIPKVSSGGARKWPGEVDEEQHPNGSRSVG
jgi:hypothetical protein